MEIHHTKHHAAYTKNFNAALEKASVEGKSAEEIVANYKELASEIQTAVRNNGGGFVNHKLFWSILSPNGGGEPTGALLVAINNEFGSFDEFKVKFSGAAKTRFGSGWAFLCIDSDKKLCVCSKPNQDTPLMEGKTPILGLDVWEHAYYKKYGPDRPGYIDAWWNVVDWNQVEENFKKSIE